MTSRFLKQLAFGIMLVAGFSLNASAAGLGKMVVNSPLGAPLNATVSLHGLEDLAQEQVRLSIAGQDAHEKLGLERNFFLTQLKFKIAKIENGRATVTITSQDAVHVPAIEMALQLRWPDGEMIKGYTLLIEPPITQ